MKLQKIQDSNHDKWAWHIMNMSLAFLISLILSILMCNRSNTLHHNANWSSQKISLTKGVMGSIAFLTSRVALAENELNLNSWYGYQQLELKNKSYSKSIQFQFKLKTDQSYFTFHFGKQDKKKVGIQISRNKDHPTQFIIIHPSGEFASTYPIKNLILNSTTSVLELLKSNHQLELKINNQRIPIPSEVSQFLGSTLVEFRGSAFPVSVDTIVADKDTRHVFHEDFSNYKSILSLQMLCTFVFFMFIFLFRKKYKGLNLVFILLVILSSAVTMVDYFYLSRIYPSENPKDSQEYKVQLVPHKNLLENLEHLLSNSKKSYPTLLFIGTSQTWGSGAEREEDTFVYQTPILFNKLHSQKVTALNAGIPGWESTSLLNHYKRTWYKFKPELLILNLANNDEDNELFRTNINEFISFSKSKNIKIVLLLEANDSNQKISQNLTKNHSTLKELALKHGITFINTHDFIVSKKNSGYLWWDTVHLTNYGQLLIAKRIATDLKQVLFSEQ